MRRMLVLVLALCALGATAAVAATKNGITPRAPKAGATVDVGSRPVFKGRVTGPGQVYVYVARTRRTTKDGVLRDYAKDGLIQRAKVKRKRFSVKARYYGYPEYWLNRPGTYYWQAHRINCGEDGTDCLQEGPIVKFKVR